MQFETGSINVHDRRTRVFVIVILCCTAFVIVVHLAGLGAYPLMGTTEGRYAEMARKMVLTGQYLMPMFTDTEPFWGKPPLSLWLSALSMQVFGINEFAARFPAWLCSLGTTFLLYRVVAAQSGPRLAALATLILSSSLLGYVAFAKVHTDAALTFCVALALFGIYEGVSRDDTKWLSAGFVGIGLGLLAKGPVTLVYAGLPLLAWLCYAGKLRAFVSSWKTAAGCLLVVALALPWYLAAEQAHPGYLAYYLIGEHLQRFIDPGWLGDLYGAGHAEARGTIVLFALEGLLPWSLIIPVLFVGTVIRRGWRNRPRLNLDAGTVFYLFWAVLPLLFFSLSANVVPTYVMPTLVAWSILSASALASVTSQLDARALSWVPLVAVLIPCAKLVQNVTADAWYTEPRNQRPLIHAFEALREDRTQPLIYAGTRRYAAEFYSDGIRYTHSLAELPNDRDFYLAMRDGREPFPVPANCRLRTAINEYQLYRCAG